MQRTPDDSASSTSGISTEQAPVHPPRLTDRISDALQRGIKVLIGANHAPPRRFKTFLHGTWLGHPLHPAITDVPLGGWLLAAILDVVWLIAPDSGAWGARAAELAVVVGCLGALGSVATGMADWSDTYGAERTIGLVHGTLNTLALVLYAISAYLRLTTSTGESISGAVVGFVGLALVLTAAYLGGDMVFGKGTGVNHTAWEAASDDYEAVLPVADMAEHALRRVLVAGVPVVLLKHGESYYAIAATCSHAGGPLDEGELQQGDVVQCPWHGSRFRMRDGKALTGPATFSQPRYDVRVRGGMIELKRR